MTISKKKEKSDYELNAEKFLTDHGVGFGARLIGHMVPPYAEDEPNALSVDVWEVCLTRHNKSWSFKFWQSVHESSWTHYSDKTIAGLVKPFGIPSIQDVIDARQTHKHGNAPTAYSVLASITKNDPGTFEDFCSDFGYSDDSMRAHRIYLAVQKEWRGVERMFADCIDKLQEIQ